MKGLSVKCSLLVLVLTVALSAVAKPKSENITLYHNSSVNGTALPAGDYVVKYDVEGNNAQVKFMQGKKEVASATGQVKTLTTTVPSNQVVLNKDDRSIVEIDFSGKSSAITFESPNAKNSAKSGE